MVNDRIFKVEKIQLIQYFNQRYLNCDLSSGLKKNCSYVGLWATWNKILANAAILVREEVSSVERNSNNGHPVVEIVARKYRILRESIWDGTATVGR